MDVPVLDFKSATLYAIRVVLHSADTLALRTALDARMKDAAGFFDDEPVVIDAGRITEPLDWQALLDGLAAHRLPVIGVTAQEENLAAAQALGLVHVALPSATARNEAAAVAAANAAEAANVAPPPAPPAAAEVIPEVGVAVDKAAAAAAPVPAPPPAGPQYGPTMIIDRPLRSGQKVYARHADLIVIGVVSHGAEVIADGNIHVYGPLRGKAMAGARGDVRAKIFTTFFDAELIAVAGVYRSIATSPPNVANQAAVVRLDGERLLVEPLKT
ncbi:septum site-determining protein MinC [Pigmentiphaga aceris]|uniref:Probable septum site-determining protein MinC n=1 Tax=Pigmentiphaga aceris TaxID=1940612 RepID=A0A5C0B3Q2_9BURK|nr:septum site-determining protein MinC [Pigmentiphaga aceris]QEI08293.1 septum site-determining protein MinC [Pigmentiphaga aceris]